MARLHITEVGGMKITIVADVMMPDKKKRNYAACGPDGLKEIIARIETEKDSKYRSLPCLPR